MTAKNEQLLITNKCTHTFECTAGALIESVAMHILFDIFKPQTYK